MDDILASEMIMELRRANDIAQMRMALELLKYELNHSNDNYDANAFCAIETEFNEYFRSP